MKLWSTYNPMNNLQPILSFIAFQKQACHKENMHACWNKKIQKGHKEWWKQWQKAFKNGTNKKFCLQSLMGGGGLWL